MQAFLHLISRIHFKINCCHSNGVNSLDTAIMNIENGICTLELSDPFYDSHTLLMEHYAKLADHQRQCSIKWAQRAHLLWIKDGDKNTHFFHTIAHTHSHFNFISQVTDVDGNVYCDRSEIDQVFLKFYSKLWYAPQDNNVVNILNLLPDDLPLISDVDGQNLTHEVTSEEVYLIVLDLPTGKSLGLDSFNAEFILIFCRLLVVVFTLLSVISLTIRSCLLLEERPTSLLLLKRTILS